MSIFVLTGNSAMSDRSLKTQLENLGHTVRKSVSSEVNYVVLLESPNGAKIKNAKALDIKFWDEEQLIEFLKLKPTVLDEITDKEMEFIDSRPHAEVTVQVKLSELKRWAQLTGWAINPTVIFVKDDYEGMMSSAMLKADESIKELNESIHEVLDGSK